MEEIKSKMFESYSLSLLQSDLNSFLSELGPEQLIDIRFSTSFNGIRGDTITSVLVIYKEEI